MRNEVRDTGIDVVGEAPWGTHFCQFYQTRDDLLDILVPYFKAGLENNEFCMWVTSEPLDAGQAEEAFRRALPDLDRYLESGQLEILPYSDWYTKGGAFDARRVLDGWLEKLDRALARGFDGLRLSGNTFWLERRDWADFTAYEEAVNDVIGRHRMIAVCTYCLDRCSAHEVMDVVRNHQFALIKRDGEWESIQSEEQKRSQAKVRRQNALLAGINRILLEALSCETEEELGRACLAVAEEVTQSEFGFIGEIGEDGRLHDIAFSDSGWGACRMDHPAGHRNPLSGPAAQGIYGRVLLKGKGMFSNDPVSHPDAVGLPAGHPPLKCFMGVPLTQSERVVGIVAVGNREGGYREEELETLEVLAPAIVQALMRVRAEAERERLLAAEQEARTLAERAVKCRDEFISIAAHELKTPVTSLLGFSQLTLRELARSGTVDPVRLARAMETMEKQSLRLARLQEQLLNLSHLEAGRLALAREESDLAHLVEAVVADVGHLHPERAFELRMDRPRPALVDPLRIEQVVVNLLDNAIKFSAPDSKVEVEVGQDGAGWARLAVRDHGIGIPPGEEERIFDRFHQAHPGLHAPGMGIGLYVSRQIVEMHGGTISVERPEGKGSRFVVRLPTGENGAAKGDAQEP